jgi:hypothetical protein
MRLYKDMKKYLKCLKFGVLKVEENDVINLIITLSALGTLGTLGTLYLLSREDCFIICIKLTFAYGCKFTFEKPSS